MIPIRSWPCLLAMLLLTFGAVSVPARAAATVDLYDVFEIEVTNDNTYDNPFDFDEIELAGRFTAPSGREIEFFGFHDGDGQGGQSGKLWKLRFMPEETGPWTYVYEWRGHGRKPAGGGGSFTVRTGAHKGPLRIFPANARYFTFADGQPFYPRAYYFSEVFCTDDEKLWLRDGIGRYFGGTYRYNLIVTIFWQCELLRANGWSALEAGREPGPFYPLRTRGQGAPDYAHYDLAQWARVDRVLRELTRRQITWYNFDGIFPNVGGDLHRQDRRVQRNFIKYYLARIAPYPYVMHNIAFEYDEFMSDRDASWIAEFVKANDPFRHPLSVHARSVPPDFSWSDFTAIQMAAGTEADAGRVQRYLSAIWAARGKPILCVECSWEGDEKLNGDEIRRGAWGQVLAGAAHIYAEQFFQGGRARYGDGDAFRYLEIMHDFMQDMEFWTLAPDLKVARDTPDAVAMSHPGEVYIIYAPSGGRIGAALPAVPDGFAVEWLNPRTGALTRDANVKAAGPAVFETPDMGDWVLRLRLRRPASD